MINRDGRPGLPRASTIDPVAKQAKEPNLAHKTGTDGIYAGDFAGFIERRNELAKRLAAEGDSDAAKEARGLKKPTRVAWAVNQLSHREPKLKDRLLEAGATLRTAQARLVSGKGDADEARLAGEGEREVVAQLVEAAESLAEGDGTPLSAVGIERARQTLHAVALVDDVRDRFERGRLTEEHEAVGFGAFSPAGAPAGRAKSERPARDEQRKRAREALKKAESAERDLRRSHTAAEARLEQADRDVKQAQQARQAAAAALEDVETKLAEAEPAPPRSSSWSPSSPSQRLCSPPSKVCARRTWRQGSCWSR